MSDLFAAPSPPANRHEAKTSVGCVYDALVSLACRQWAWKREVETFADNLLLARSNGTRRQELESIGRNVRHVRTGLAGSNWTVIDAAGRLCLCMATDEPAMLAALPQSCEVKSA